MSLDLKKDFVENYIFPTLKFGAKYEDYLLGTSFARPLHRQAHWRTSPSRRAQTPSATAAPARATIRCVLS